MARQSRLSLPGHPHHVIQRGNNRQAIFSSNADREFLLALLVENSKKFHVALHAYLLMENHFHLLLTPSTGDGLAQMMQAVGRRYVRYYNDLTHRSGTLWEGRYRSTVLQTETYLLKCMAYLDLNPVRAGLVALPIEYPWSSFGHYVGLRVDRAITPHPAMWQLGNTPFAREAAYTNLVQMGLDARTIDALTDSALHGWLLGDADFIKRMQSATSRRLVRGLAGRPPKGPEVDAT